MVIYELDGNRTKPVLFPKCGFAYGKVDCVSQSLDSINCNKAASSLNIELHLDHAAWCDKCRFFFEKEAVKRRKVYYLIFHLSKKN